VFEYLFNFKTNPTLIKQTVLDRHDDTCCNTDYSGDLKVVWETQQENKLKTEELGVQLKW
jgi:hypothetical protein